MSTVQFKKGTLVRNLTDESSDITPGKTYKVTLTTKDVVHFDDDAGYPRYRPGDRYAVVRASPRDYVADHARRTLRKAGLSKEEARQVVENWPADWSIKLSQLSRKLPMPLSEILLLAFDWGSSKQGFNYWAKIHDREYYREEKERNAQAQ